jgi:hypothetical protein
MTFLTLINYLFIVALKTELISKGENAQSAGDLIPTPGEIVYGYEKGLL